MVEKSAIEPFDQLKMSGGLSSRTVGTNEGVICSASNPLPGSGAEGSSCESSTPCDLEAATEPKDPEPAKRDDESRSERKGEGAYVSIKRSRVQELSWSSGGGTERPLVVMKSCSCLTRFEKALMLFCVGILFGKARLSVDMSDFYRPLSGKKAIRTSILTSVYQGRRRRHSCGSSGRIVRRWDVVRRTGKWVRKQKHTLGEMEAW